VVRVSSEIDRLEVVLVHEPGPEVDRMVPSMMEELLFDDILYGDRAREEHARFRRVLHLLGVEVLEAADVLAEALAEPAAREFLVGVLGDECDEGTRGRLREAPADLLARTLVHGLRPERPTHGIEVRELFELAPLPNWCFQRDPQIVLGSGVVFCAMASSARHRESMLARAIFRFHPDFRDVPVWFDALEVGRDAGLFTGLHAPKLEGGDVLVLSPEVIAVGHSERTDRVAIAQLARALARREGAPRYLVVVDLPKRRAYMHLDTLVTPIDRDTCLAYPPVMVESGPERAPAWTIDLHAAEPAAASERPGLLEALAELGLDLEPVPCGGSDPVLQQREQWTDGANALAVAPGVVTLYDRNVATAEELDRRGFRVVHDEDLLLGREEIDVDAGQRVCVLLASHEISRARGGPHCLTHPVRRAAVA
jgi:arginine deiminase